MSRILIADDHPIFLEGLATLLEGAGYDVVARCKTGAEVLEALVREKPDLLLLDVSMPPPTGLEIVRVVKEAQDPVKIVLLTSSLDDLQTLEAIELGVNGLVLKESAPRQLVQCFNAVRAGDNWYDPQIARRALDVALSSQRPASPTASLLTNRELQVTRLVAAGLRNKEIACELKISEGTVKMYLHTIYEKSRVGNRVELVNLAHANLWL
ncbi:response regulator [Puniceibacterium confluentis]|uniref:response regulator n=1 Tax=Puniceibacterium confluentis TaxID=1958944 RepID=UPI0011B8124D|nr:response regulator transcription factor [Puniceibacterium confluentis]